MTFGEVLEIWSRVANGDKTLTADEVKEAARWLDDFIKELGEKNKNQKRHTETLWRLGRLPM